MINLRFPDARWDLYSLAVAFPEYGAAIDPVTVPTPRWIKTHLSFSPAYKNVVYLVRDGRDAAVSFYHWAGTSEPFDEFVRHHVLRQSGAFLSWQDHVTEWMTKMPQNSLFIRYEDLIGDGAIHEFQRLATAMGLERTDDDIRLALTKSSYEKQQKDFSGHHLLKDRAVGVGGGAGKWREYFSNELHDDFWRIAGDSMTKAGYQR